MTDTTTPTISKDQARQYLSNGGNTCPACGSDQFQGEEITVDNGHASQQVRCVDCNAWWYDVYDLAAIVVGDEHSPDGKEYDYQQQPPDAADRIRRLEAALFSVLDWASDDSVDPAQNLHAIRHACRHGLAGATRQDNIPELLAVLSECGKQLAAMGDTAHAERARTAIANAGQPGPSHGTHPDLVRVASLILTRLDLEAREQGEDAVFPCNAHREQLREALNAEQGQGRAVRTSYNEPLLDERGDKVWCEQCGEEPATVTDPHANLCRACADRH